MSVWGLHRRLILSGLRRVTNLAALLSTASGQMGGLIGSVAGGWVLQRFGPTVLYRGAAASVGVAGVAFFIVSRGTPTLGQQPHSGKQGGLQQRQQLHSCRGSCVQPQDLNARSKRQS